MNRSEQRGALRRHPDRGISVADNAWQLIRQAAGHYENGDFVQAERLCRKILSHEPDHVHALTLHGAVAQASGRNNNAVKLLGRALALDGRNAAIHNNIALAYQALGRREEAVEHFSTALAVGLQHEILLVKRAPAVGACLAHFAKSWPRRLDLGEIFAPGGVAAFAGESILEALLLSRCVCDVELERFLTSVRSAFLAAAANDSVTLDDTALGLFCALAQQCFINEYVFATSDDELVKVEKLYERLLPQLAGEGDVPIAALIALACYRPLHTLENAERLLIRPWPTALARLLACQIREPLEERRDRSEIAALTLVDDTVSVQVRQQYEDNPYPRWTTRAPTSRPPMAASSGHDLDILIAGCGSGLQAIEAAESGGRVLAIDISLASLAYARRKTRDAGLNNITYAQADILRLGVIGRTFDRIEAVGVLHHLADPFAGWRGLLRLLRPGGTMKIGLYSERGRRFVVAGRAEIAARGYQATPGDIRRFRQDLIGRNDVPAWPDFFSTSGCRDLFFHVMEHRLSIPQIGRFLDEQGLRFLGFDLGASVLEKFRHRYVSPDAAHDLACWHAFEEANPSTFAAMYLFSVRKPG
jgi:SAM-dependent methyltransferase